MVKINKESTANLAKTDFTLRFYLPTACRRSMAGSVVMDAFVGKANVAVTSIVCGALSQTSCAVLK